MVRLMAAVFVGCGGAAMAGPSDLELRFAAQTEARSLPSVERLFTRFNPGVEAGLGWAWWRNGRLSLFQEATVGVWHHAGLATSFAARTTGGVRVRLWERLELGAGLSVGYLGHGMEPRLFLRTDEGFAATAQWLNRFLGGVALEVAFRAGRVTPFVAYAAFVEAPFLAKFSPVLPLQALQFGVRIALGETP